MNVLIASYIGIIVAAVWMWIANLLWIIDHAGSAITGLFLFKLVGLVPPFQFITVWFG